MKISIAVSGKAPAAYPAIYKTSLFENVCKAHDLGYDGIEWHLRRPEQREIEAMQQLLATLNFKVNALGTGMACLYDGLTLMDPVPAVRIQAIERLKEFIDMAAALDCMVIIGSMKGKIPVGAAPDVFEKYCIDSLKPVLEYAENRRVTVVLEVINRYESNFLNTIEQMDSFIGKLDYPALKSHIDTFHMNIEEADLYQSIIAGRKHLGHVHFADSNRYWPGAGHLDFKQVMNALREINYQEWIAVECHAKSDPDLAAQQAVQYIHSI